MSIVMISCATLHGTSYFPIWGRN